MLIADILLVIASLLVLSMVAASLCRLIAIPYTVLLVILGLLATLMANTFSVAALSYLDQFHLTPDLVLFVFLPALIFESVLLLDARALLKNIVPILGMAILGMLISVALVAIGVWWSLGLNITVALLFASLISATDPVAVIALFKKLGVSSRLTILIEGESLMNDAVAIVLFSIVLLTLSEQNIEFSSVLQAFKHFCYVFFGGVFVGVLTGSLFGELLVRLFHGNQSIPVVLSLALAYMSFIIAEHLLHVSGVMAVLSAAIFFNLAGLSRLANDTTEIIHIAWAVLELVFNSLLFFLVGLSVDLITLTHYWQPIAWAVLAVYSARAVSVYLLLPLITGRLTSFSWAEKHVAWWGGVKGGLAIAIVMTIPDSLPEKELLQVLTTGVVLTSLLFNASTLRWLISALKMDALSANEQAELKLITQRVNESANHVLSHFSNLQLLDGTIAVYVESKLKDTLDFSGMKLSDEQQLRQVHLNALRAEKNEMEDLYEMGAVNYTTLVSFRSLLRVDQQHSIDYLKSMGVGWLQPSFLLDFEKLIIHSLSEKDWAHRVLSKYQTHRFANKIQHDIAGVLMANRALKSIEKQVSSGVDESLIAPIRKIYQTRLIRRQNRLQYFSRHYPEFYKQYEAYLFQKVSLRYSLKIARESHEHGIVSTKVWQILYKKLSHSFGQAPSLKMSLRIVEAEGWIKRIPLFSDLPSNVVQEIVKITQYVNFLPKDTLFYQGEVGDSLYIVLSGEVNILAPNEKGVITVVEKKGEGEVAGELKSMDEKRVTSAVAETYVTCLRVHGGNLKQLAANSLELKKCLNNDRE
ncbi:MAG: cation:proton antiporter [Methyloprofundus sp.]|nr:cation:proton antiporter [Methyloprofundus sp.]